MSAYKPDVVIFDVDGTLADTRPLRHLVVGPSRDFNPGQVCSFCGHAWPHPLPCPGHITVGAGKQQRRANCPCTHVAQNSNNDPKV